MLDIVRTSLCRSVQFAVALVAVSAAGCGQPVEPSSWRIRLDDDCPRAELATDLIRARVRAMSGVWFAEGSVERRENQLAVELSSRLPAAAIQVALSTVGQLSFHGLDSSEASSPSDEVRVLASDSENLVVERQPLLAPTLEESTMDYDAQQRPVIALVLTREDGARMREETSARIGERIAVLLDGELLTAPVVESVVARHLQIEGAFDAPEARALAVALSAGPLPCAVTVSEVKR